MAERKRKSRSLKIRMAFIVLIGLFAGAFAGSTTLGITVNLNAQESNKDGSFTHEAAPLGGDATYTWNNFKAGSYLYQSGTHPAIQVQMGLFGNAKKDAASGQAYPGNTYSLEGIVIFSEIDTVMHEAVAGGGFEQTKSRRRGLFDCRF